MTTPKQNVVVVGNGMVGQRFVDRLLAGPLADDLTVTVIGEESRYAYDRVGLSKVFEGASEDDLNLLDPTILADSRATYLRNVKAEAINPETKTVALDNGEQRTYDKLVLATGSSAFVPPITGKDLDGCFVYRTLDDVENIRAWTAQDSCTTGVVIGGGLLGLEAARSLQSLGVDVHVLEMAPHLMPLQLGSGGGSMLGRWVGQMGVELYTGAATSAINGSADDGASGTVTSLSFDHRGETKDIDCQIVVFSAGIRPRDELGRHDDLLELGPRGGVAINSHLETSIPDIYAIGEVAAHDGRCYGLVAPGYDMADILAKRLAGDTESAFTGADMSAKLKLLGVDVASFGSTTTDETTDEVIFSNPGTKIHRRLITDKETGQLLGGSLVGDASGYELLRSMAIGDIPTDPELASYVLPADISPVEMSGTPDGMQICSCNNVSIGDLRCALGEGHRTTKELGKATGCGTSCGGCVPALTNWLKEELTSMGEAVSNDLCEHFAFSRQELFDLVRLHKYRSWSEVKAAHGAGLGCEICRPTVASILASIEPSYVLEGDGAAIQDTNDHSLANMQRNGTYSIVPRIPGGEITPDQLIALGQIAKDYDLYAKITGGQRVDLFGATLGQLPEIWQRVLDAGMESGHAYGKSLRTVKSCVGDTWCRYGVQDSVSMAILVEKRYRGLRSPHKIKMAVSGCTRECAEAQSKDVGIIATETGWNLYVAGNGGRTPRHAELLASDLTDDELISAIDRFLMFYIRTADRLQRTSTWMEAMDGGVDYVRTVVLEDRLGIGDELEADIAHHVKGYECEWAATLGDEDRLAHFVEFVNEPESNSQPVWIEKRSQRVPA